MTARPRRLGRGLEALLGDTEPSDSPTASSENGRQHDVPIEALSAGPYQPRRRFDPGQIDALADSIREKGIMQPILVRPLSNQAGRYQIVAGERRWRAAQRARLHRVPVVVHALADREALEIAIIENVQREDLTPLEEADGYRRLMDEFSGTQEEIARIVGKSRSHIANTLRLLALPAPVREMVDDSRLSAGHARALLTAKDPAGLAKTVVSKGWNVRQTEDAVRREGRVPSKSPAARNPDVVALEHDLAAVTGLKIVISDRGERGDVRIAYNSLEQLDDIIRRLRKSSV